METNIVKFKKLLKSGEIHLVDTDAIASDMKKEPSAGDSLQYELHNYCKKNMKPDENVTHVIKLATICYSKESVEHFKNMDRFIGCIYYICSYLLKNEKYDVAIENACSLQLKKEALVQALKSSKDLFNFLCLLHRSFMSTAINLASRGICDSKVNDLYAHKLAVSSIKFFQFNNTEQLSVAKKVLKNSKTYLHKLEENNIERVREFYECLQPVLRVMIPRFSSSDFCMYYLFKIEQMQNIDYSEGRPLYEKMEKIIHLISLFSNISSKTKNGFKSLLNFFFASTFQCLSVPEYELIINDVRNCQTAPELMFVLISNIFHHGIQHWWKVLGDDWSSKVSVELLHPLITIILKLHKEFYKSSKLYCSSSKTSHDICFGDLLTGNLQKIQYTIRQCLKNKVAKSISLIPLSREALKLSIDCIRVMKKMGCCEMQRSYAWKYAVIHHTNLVEDILKEPLTNEIWILLADCSRELLHEIVSSDYELPYDMKRVNILFQRWHQAVLKQQKFHDGLFVCIAFYASYPGEESDFIPMWLRTKSECGNEIFQEMTALEVLTKCESAIKEFNPKFNKNGIKTKSVLLMELKAYGSCPDETFKDSKTCYGLVSRLWKHLEKLDLDVWERSFAYTCLVSANIAGEERQLPKSFSDKCDDVIDKLVGQGAKGKLQCRSFVHAGNLRFSLFLYNVKTVENAEAGSQTNELVLGYLKKAEEEKVKLGDDIDANLTCNVIPTSSHLTVDLESNYLDTLKEIVDLWERALDHGGQRPTAPEFKFWMENVQLVACLYELYGEYQRSTSTWLLFYRIGKLCNDLSAVLLGLSHVLVHCSDVDAEDLLKESDDVSGQLAGRSQDKETLVVYWLTLASNHLKNKRSEKCLEKLKASRKVLDGLRTTPKSHILQIKYWCLVSQFLTYYPDHEVEFGYCRGTGPRVPVFKAFGYAASSVKNNLFQTATQLECTEKVLAMLEVSLWAFHFYEIYSQTDFMRFFLDDLYQLVQKLFLPTRTAEMLVRLAEVDLICEKASDCHEKITKLKSILGILPSEKYETSSFGESKLPCALQDCHKTSPRAISPVRFLDVSSVQTDDVSPIHMHLTQVNNKSEMVRHGSSCKCRVCRNILIQVLTMATHGLEAEVLMLENRSKGAVACYAEAHRTLNRLELLRADETESLRLEMSDTLKTHARCLDFQARFVQFHAARFWLRYAFFDSSLTHSFSENARKGVGKIAKLMKQFSYEQKLLMWKFAKLKLLWLVFTRGEPAPVRKESPKELKSTTNVMKTPFIGRSGTSSVRKNLAKDLSKKSSVVEVKDDESNSSDEKNTAFLGPENIPSGRKLFMQPRRLRFKTNEPPTLKKTAIKVTEPRMKNIRPKRLNLDQAD